MLSKLQIQALHLYTAYQLEHITLNEYLESVRPIDNAIDSLELKLLSCCLSDNPAFERSSLKHPH